MNSKISTGNTGCTGINRAGIFFSVLLSIRVDEPTAGLHGQSKEILKS